MNNTFKFLHQVISKLTLKAQVPNYGQYSHSLKRPINPKVVVFGNSSRAYELISSQFRNFNHVNGLELKGQEDNIQANKVAQSVLSINDGFQDGYYITDFPQNSKQAERLDLITDGVNLALYIKDPSDKVTVTRQQEAIDYYRKTGALVEFEVDPRGDLEEQVKQLSNQVLNGYKH
ncbi:hypothetical protein TTHERM_00218840 (macronuclear) [Tetrahymena thermophila SB210]|uniref:Uncharacterized protein n=1 Tax=Tetrahymena thermophila (strain SB210) TaxID=312017 RepID=I7M8Y9_TETTS|nr:hypothetical protein TTHERM_00218840 [Tetrahymena thermophila SB210]8B6H_EJ Chain EJ, YflT domain-containing protein [Tetrahymena thermophila SB210]8B6H_Ej Chain Ej, YflT domain-containing protein [Tetrahymena thermophila SB210]8BQS_EJ Chain EJ, YflT domain-containing protein [Tetrahymena thermophila SB210]8BQS_Ej Chain Ej, YflT domain-containing protein [Tetrahymena thermophila SB210]8GYM_P Chain P, YflT domain-containing protein [Tetrahymena thermophila SB210]8GYM_p Chain p, YflT domain-|eukprot:XP_001020556.3 hypothetical protein TTHERM_00218840 [Tetrahymena thermophila SB210]